MRKDTKRWSREILLNSWSKVMIGREIIFGLVSQMIDKSEKERRMKAGEKLKEELVPIKKKVQWKEGGKPQNQKVRNIRMMFESRHIEKDENKIEVGKVKELAEKFGTVRVEQSRQLTKKRKRGMNELWDTVLQK